MKRVLPLLFVLLAACSSQPNTRGELEGAIRQLTQAVARYPDNAALVYLLASHHDRAGNRHEVVRWLGELERLQWPYGVNPVDFRNTKSEEFRAAADRLNAREPRVSNAAPVFTIEGHRDAIPEGIAYDPEADVFYISSLHRRQILRVDRQGRATSFTAEGEDGMPSPLGMKVDRERRLLWVASGAIPEMRGYSPSLKGTAALYAYDLRDGRVVRKLTIGSPEQPALLNDIALLRDGSLFVTDSEGKKVHRLAAGAESLTPWLDGFTYPNGIAVSDDERHVYVADYHGITRVTLADGKRERLESSAAIGGIDGLSFRAGTLIGIQNLIGNPRVIRVHLDDGNRVEVLESKNAYFDIPTTGVVVGDRYFFIANSQLRAFDDGRIWPAERLRDPVMLALAL